MRDFVAFILYTALALLVAAALFYPAELAASALFDIAPHKILARLAKILAAIAFFFFLKHLGIWDRRILGYGVPVRRFLGGMAWGWVAGILMMLVPLLALVALDVRQLKPEFINMTELALVGAKALLAGLAVGFIEETFFRGALFGGMRRTCGFWKAAFFSSLLYAAMHFIDPRSFADSDGIGWLSGFPLLLSAFDAFATPGIWDSFIALAAAGIVLALLRTWHGSIAVAIGVHAGWVMVIKIAKNTSQDVVSSPLNFLVGSYDHIVGWLVTLWLLVVIALIARPALSANANRVSSVPDHV